MKWAHAYTLQWSLAMHVFEPTKAHRLWRWWLLCLRFCTEPARTGTWARALTHIPIQLRTWACEYVVCVVFRRRGMAQSSHRRPAHKVCGGGCRERAFRHQREHTQAVMTDQNGLASTTPLSGQHIHNADIMDSGTVNWQAGKAFLFR